MLAVVPGPSVPGASAQTSGVDDLAFASDGTLYLGMSRSSLDTVPAHPNGPISPMVARTSDLGTTHDV